MKPDLDPATPTKKNKILEWYEERKDRAYCEHEAVKLKVVKGKDDDGNQSDNGEDKFLLWKNCKYVKFPVVERWRYSDGRTERCYSSNHLEPDKVM